MNRDRWYPVGREHDIPAGHLFHTRLHGTELVLWRDDQGHLNCWENRCPHRSVRLTIGRHLGDRVKCRYHGWEFATDGGRCVHVPAHPAEGPAARIAVRTFPVQQSAGLVWTSMGAPGPFASGMAIAAGAPLLQFRGVRINSAMPAVASALAAHAWCDAPGTQVQSIGDHHIELHRGAGPLHLLLQPVDAQTTIIHGVAVPTERIADPLVVLREIDRHLVDLRDALEACAA